MTSITTLLSPSTPAQVRATAVSLLIGLGIPADQWRAGGVASTLLTVITTMFANFQSLIVGAIGSGFLETATGGWLVLLAYYVYGVTAPPATFASGYLTLTNTGGGVFSYAPGTATFQNTRSGIVYVNTTAVNLNGPGSQTIGIQATTMGSVGSSPPLYIALMVTTMIGVTCSNASAVVGSDAASDATVRAMCINSRGASSVRGPRTAFLYAVQTAINGVTGSPVNINRVSVSPSSSTGIVQVYLASPSGTPSSDDVAAVVANIEASARPMCVTVVTAPASAVSYAPAITVWAQAVPGVTTSAMQIAIGNAIAAFIAAYPIGGLTTDLGSALYASGVDGVIGPAVASLGSKMISVEGITDLPLAPGQVANDNATIVVRLVAAA